jgi:pimeloyl-ACP methyl ester carboxylesterase
LAHNGRAPRQIALVAELQIDVRRRFVRVEGRGVHYLRAGDGPPVVLLHSALLSARFELPLLRRLACDHTVFAFDNPGFGDSDPLPTQTVRIPDAADALNATLVTLGMPRCAVYGSHTGGAIAVELARRHPARVAALIVDGINLFGARDTRLLLSEQYRPALTVADDGSHLFANWVKTRDSLIWFPWYRRSARNRLPWPFPSAQELHDFFLDRLRAGNGYQALYGAVFRHDLRKAVMALTVPATFMAQAHDILFPHLARLPKLKANQRIRRYPADLAAYVDEKARVVRDYQVRANAPSDTPFQPTPGAINRRYVDVAGGQVLVRSAGEGLRGRPLLLLHDGRASSRTFERLIRVLARRRGVYAPDLPDNGASDALDARRPGIEDYADAVADTVNTLDLAPCDVYAVGSGAAVALNLLARPAFESTRAALETPDFYTPTVARRLMREWVPPLAPDLDGAHLNRLWLMLRDEYAFWPWFDKSPTAACAADSPDDWWEMHARVTDILRSLPTYHRLTLAALRYDWISALRRLRKRTVVLTTAANDARRSHTEAAAQLARLPKVIVLSVNAEARAISKLFGR